MDNKQKAGIAVLVLVGVLFYLTLGAGLMRNDDGREQHGDQPPEPPAWTAWIDRVTTPLQPRLQLNQTRWVLDGTESLVVAVPPSDSEARRADFVITSDGGGATITYDCRCSVGGETMEPSSLPERPQSGSMTVRFSALAAGGRFRFEGAGGGRHRIELK